MMLHKRTGVTVYCDTVCYEMSLRNDHLQQRGMRCTFFSTEARVFLTVEPVG